MFEAFHRFGPRLQWGRRSASTERAGTTPAWAAPKVCFNGAVDQRRRREGYGSPGDLAMAVLQWGRRSASTESWGSRCRGAGSRPCFNGAVDQRRRRGGDGAEVRVGEALASMGPSISVDGEVTSTSYACRAVTMLQWGRRSASTESVRAENPANVGASLQWGRRSASTERSAWWSGAAAGAGRFNGAVDQRRRRDHVEIETVRREAASMGPSISVDGEVPGSSCSDWMSMASMGPSISVDGEAPPRAPSG